MLTAVPDPKFPFSAETLKGDTREARDVLGKRFVEYAAEKGWDAAAADVDELEAGLLFLWGQPGGPSERAAVLRGVQAGMGRAAVRSQVNRPTESA